MKVASEGWLSKPSSLHSKIRQILYTTKSIIILKKKVKMNKKAQFYLIAAILIVGIVVILAGITNYITTRKAPVKFYDLGNEFKEEGTRVVDYGIYNSQNTLNLMESLAEQFKDYSEEKDIRTELVFVFGNTEGIRTVTYTTHQTGEVSLTVPGSSFGITGTPQKVANVEDRTPSGTFDEVKVEILEQEYTFELHEGENFFFVISKKTSDEEYIASKE